MGTDIHIVVEERASLGWVTVNTLTDGFHLSQQGTLKQSDSLAATARNYKRFVRLAGIRGGGEGPSPKGFPEDASDTARLLYNRDPEHYHSASWLPMVEALDVFLETECDAIRTGITDPAYVYFDVEDGDIERSRIVFWFED